MDPEQLKKILKAAGITTGVLTAATLVVVGFMVYRNYFEVRKLKLEIRQLERE